VEFLDVGVFHFSPGYVAVLNRMASVFKQIFTPPAFAPAAPRGGFDWAR
jgi:hypothetical protein